jgi:cytochrome b
MKTKPNVRWVRVLIAIAAVPLFWIAVGAPVVALVWTGLVLLVAAMLIALRLGWGTTTPSIAEVIHDVEGEAPPLVFHPASVVPVVNKAG